MFLKIGYFEIKRVDSGGQLGVHWDIYVEGNDESVVTVWESLYTAKVICKSLTKRIDRKMAKNAGAVNADRSGINMEVRV